MCNCNCQPAVFDGLAREIARYSRPTRVGVSMNVRKLNVNFPAALGVALRECNEIEMRGAKE